MRKAFGSRRAAANAGSDQANDIPKAAPSMSRRVMQFEFIGIPIGARKDSSKDGTGHHAFYSIEPFRDSCGARRRRWLHNRTFDGGSVCGTKCDSCEK